MGEQELEKRLDRLKSSYDRMPTVSNPDNIIKNIQIEIEPPVRKKKNYWRSWTIAASFIGVLLISGVLASELLMKSSLDESANEMPKSVADQEVEMMMESNPAASMPVEGDTANPKITSNKEEQKLNKQEATAELSKLFTAQKRELATALGVEESLKGYSFVEVARAEIDQFTHNNYVDADDMEKAYQQASENVLWQLAMPQEALILLEARADELSEGELNTKIEELLSKQDKLKVELFSRFKENANLTHLSPAIIDALNAGVTLDHNEAATREAKFVRDNGYQFYDEGEGQLNIKIDYDYYVETFGDQLPEAWSDYIRILPQLQWAADAAVLGGWDKLSDRIVTVEQFILRHPNFKQNRALNEQYQYMVRAYLYGIDNSRIFTGESLLKREVRTSYERFLEKYADTETYSILSDYYALLEKNNFSNTAEVSAFEINWPELYQ